MTVFVWIILANISNLFNITGHKYIKINKSRYHNSDNRYIVFKYKNARKIRVHGPGGIILKSMGAANEHCARNPPSTSVVHSIHESDFNIDKHSMKILARNEIYNKTEVGFDSIVHRLEVNCERKAATFFAGFAKKVFQDFYKRLKELHLEYWFHKIGITGRPDSSVYCRHGYTNKSMIKEENKLNWPPGNALLKDFENGNIQNMHFVIITFTNLSSTDNSESKMEMCAVLPHSRNRNTAEVQQFVRVGDQFSLYTVFGQYVPNV